MIDGIHHDLARHPAEQRQRLTGAARRYPRRSAPGEHTEALLARLEAASGQRPLSDQHKGDLWQIAVAVTAGVGVLPTWDDHLRARFAQLREAVVHCAAIGVPMADPAVGRTEQATSIR